MHLLTLPRWQIALAYLVVYTLLDAVSHVFPLAPLGITPWNPAAGLSVALILLLGPGYLPLLFVAPLLADIGLRGMPLPWPAELAVVGMLGTGYAAATAILADPRVRFDPALPSLRDLFVLLLVGVTAPAIVSLAYVAVFVAFGLLPPSEYPAAFVHHWVGDAIGIFVVTPFLLSLFTAPRLPKATIESAFQVLAIAAALWVIFSYARASEFQFFYLLFLPIIWIALRHGLEGVSAGLFLAQAGLILALHWSGQSPRDVAKFQILMLVLAMTGLLLGVAISEQRRSQNRLRLHQEALARASRLTSLSALSATLAHEVNQPLTAIGNYNRLLRDMIACGEGNTITAQEASVKAIAQVDHAAGLIRRFREFVRTGKAEMVPTSPAVLISETIALAKPLLAASNVVVAIQVQSDAPDVMVDRLQFELVLLNLITNSVEAITQSGRSAGRVTLEARRSSEAGYVEIGVRDDGPGFEPEFLEDVAAPFATTKPEGTGIGLPLSRTIVERHHGQLILSNTSNGASIVIKLPKVGGAHHDGD
jgi:two-component system sensor kinase FixL